MALSGNTSIIGSPVVGSVYVFVRRDDGTWEDVQKLTPPDTPADGENGDWFGSSVAISGDTAIIGASRDNERGYESGSGYVYTKIGGKWIENGKIFPEDCYLGAVVTFLGIVLPFRGVLLSLAPFGQDKKIINNVCRTPISCPLGRIWWLCIHC